MTWAPIIFSQDRETPWLRQLAAAMVGCALLPMLDVARAEALLASVAGLDDSGTGEPMTAPHRQSVFALRGTLLATAEALLNRPDPVADGRLWRRSTQALALANALWERSGAARSGINAARMHYALGLTASAPPDRLAADMRRYRDEPLDLLADAHLLLRLAACAWRLAGDGEASFAAVAALLEQDQANLTARLQRVKVPDLAPADHRSEADLRRVIERSRTLEAALLPMADAESAATALNVLERVLPQWLGHGVLPLWLEGDDALTIHGSSDLAGQRLRLRGRRSLAAAAVASGEVTVLRMAAADLQATSASSDWSASDPYSSEGFAQDSNPPEAEVKVAVFDRQCAERLGVAALAALPVGAPEPVAVLLTSADVDADELKLVSVHAGRWLTCFAAVERRLQQAADEQRAGFSLRAREAVHEISNPLSVMQNYLHLLGNRIAADDPAKEQVGLITEELRRAASLLRTLTDDERANSVTTGATEGADLNALVADVLALLEGSLNAGAPIDVRFTPAIDLPPLTVADHRLRQVLLNLSRNALEAMPQGGILDVMVDQAVTDGGRRGVEISVSDTGRGIEPTLLDRIFESGVSVKGEGRGLGLAITRRLVHELGGEISCRSRVGAGTTFVVWLPAL